MEEVGQEILKLYSLLPENGKPDKKQYTILSGIVAYIPLLGHIPICLCTGTKCLSNTDPNFSPGSTLSDSHAEVLARRSLIRYFLLCLIEIMRNSSYEFDDSCPFRIGDCGKFELKPEWTFWMYVSDSPCGEASIYQRSSVERNFTGKKSRIVNSSIPETASSSLLRCKPGRVDIENSRRSSSMSCSDKICRWSCLGLQGALLSKFVKDPIFLSGLVISEDLASKEEDGQQAAIHRAISDRLPCLNTNLLTPRIPEIYFTNLQYENGKCFLENQQYSHSTLVEDQCVVTQPSPTGSPDIQLSNRKRRAISSLQKNPCAVLKSCSTNINWIRSVGSIPDGKIKSQCQGGTIEITLANTGRPQGTTKATASKSRHINESRLCRRALGRLCVEFETHYLRGQLNSSSNTDPDTLCYRDYKRIGNERYLQYREDFLRSEAFRDWSTDDSDISKMFPLMEDN